MCSKTVGVASCGWAGSNISALSRDLSTLLLIFLETPLGLEQFTQNIIHRLTNWILTRIKGFVNEAYAL